MKKIFTSKMIILSLSTVILGLVLVLYAIYKEKGEIIGYQIAYAIGSTILISGLSTVLYELFIRLEFITTIEQSNNKVAQLLTISQGVEKIGLIGTLSESNIFNYKEFLENNENVIICMNDGRTWVSRNSEYLKKRFQNPTLKTTFILMDAESPALNIQADKTKTTLEALKLKLPEALEMIKKLSSKETNITVYGHNYYNPQAIFLGDNSAIVTPYYTSSGRRDVPLFIYADRGDASYFKRLKSDLEQLMEFESKKITL